MKVILLCGPTASGKTYATERVLAIDYRVTTAKIDGIYYRALREAGVPEPEGRAYSVLKEAEKLREGIHEAEVRERFFSAYRWLVRQHLEDALSWRVGMVFEGFTLRFADEARMVLEEAQAVAGEKASVARVQLKPSLEAWDRNRFAKVRRLGGKAPGLVKPAYYERQMAGPEPLEGVRDYVLQDPEQIVPLMDDEIGLTRHKWYQRFSLGPISTQGSSDVAEKVSTVLDSDLIGKTVLDFCCATGVAGIMAKDRGAARVVGIDKDARSYCKGLELKKVLLRHSDVDAKVDLRLGDAVEILPSLPRFDTVLFFGALHYFEDYAGTLGMLAGTGADAAYVEFTFSEKEHDTSIGEDGVHPYVRSRTGTTIWMANRRTVTNIIHRVMPGFSIEERTPISPPGRTLVSEREVWRLRRL